MNFFRSLPMRAFFLLLFFPFYLKSQQKEQLTNLLPLEQGLTMGKLSNGLTYYIKHNKKPKNHCLLSLAVRIGSLVELPHERGLAHFIEHLAFKGSSQFQNENELIQYFSDHGVQFAADQNAHTGIEETVYKLALPAHDDELIKCSMNWLSDVAGRLPLTAKAIESERRIILDEIQFRNDASLRAHMMLYNTFSGKLAVGNRFPGGVPDVISNATAKTIRNFYKTWYRPELMAIIFVGDYDPCQIKELIEHYFSPLPAITGPQPPTATLDALQQQVIVHVDPERTVSSCSMMASLPRTITSTVTDVRKNLITDILCNSLEQRLTQQASGPASHFTLLSNKFSPSLYDRTLFQLYGNFKNGHALPACTELFRAYQQLLFGVTAAEFESARNALIADTELFITNYSTQEHAFFSANFLGNFLEGNTAEICDSTAFAKLARTLLFTITTQEVNDYINAELAPAATCLFYKINEAEISNTDKETFAAQLTTELVNASQKAVEAYWYEQKLLAAAFPVGENVSSTVEDLPLINAHKITLSNDIVVYFKQTNYTEDKLTLSGVARGGSSHFIGQEDQAEAACIFIDYAGFGGLLPHEIAESLRQYQDISTSCAFTHQWRKISATGRKINFARAMEILFSSCTQLNFNATQFALLQEDLHRRVDNAKNNPGLQFGLLFDERTKIHSRLYKQTTHARIDALDEQIMHSIFTKSFGNWSDFTFVVSGNASLAEVREILEKTVGCLPKKLPQQFSQEQIFFDFTDIVQETLPERSEKQCMTLIASPINLPLNEMTNVLLSTIKTILGMRLRQALRVEKELAYVTNIGFTMENNLGFDIIDSTTRLQLTFSCAPEKVNDLVEGAKMVLRTAAIDGFTSEELLQAQKTLSIHFDRKMQSDDFWHQHIIQGLFNGRGLETVDARKNRITGVTLNQLNAFYREHIKFDTCYVLTMLPKEAVEGIATRG